LPTADSCRRPVPGGADNRRAGPLVHRRNSAQQHLSFASGTARTPAAQVAALRQGFEGVARDPAFERELMARQGVPYSHIGTAQGQAIFRALAEVSPEVIRTLHDSTKAPN